MTDEKLGIIIRKISQGVMALLILSIILANLTPFGVQAVMSTDTGHQISLLGPSTRVEYPEPNVAKQFDDLAYFSTDTPFAFDHATVKVTFENSYPDQQLNLGFQNQSGYHYKTALLDAPVMNALNWNITGTGPYLYQRSKKYDSLEQFMNSAPQNLAVGIYGIPPSEFSDDNTILDGYQPSKNLTEFDTPIRGSATMYAYLENEPFQMRIEKQDLNWYKDADVLTVKIYKGNDLVYEDKIADDGVVTDTKHPGKVQELTFHNPGPDLPIPGIYRIELQGSGDTIIKKITTNLHKVVWQGPLYLASNAESYKGIVSETTPNVLFTSSIDVNVKTAHANAYQTAKIGDKSLDLNAVNQEYSTSTPGNVQITLPKSDVVVDGSGYFVYSRDQFFWPTRMNILPITQQPDLDKVDYVISNYLRNSTDTSGSRTQTVDFDLSDAYINKGKLSWIIQAPGLKSKNRQIFIKKIEIQFDKKGWFE